MIKVPPLLTEHRHDSGDALYTVRKVLADFAVLYDYVTSDAIANHYVM